MVSAVLRLDPTALSRLYQTHGSLTALIKPVARAISEEGNKVKPCVIPASEYDPKAGCRLWWLKWECAQVETTQSDLLDYSTVQTASDLIWETATILHEIEACKHQVITLTRDPAQRDRQGYFYTPHGSVLDCLWGYLSGPQRLAEVELVLGDARTIRLPPIIPNSLHVGSQTVRLVGRVDVLMRSQKIARLNLASRSSGARLALCSYPETLWHSLAAAHCSGNAVIVSAKGVHPRVRRLDKPENRYEIVDFLGEYTQAQGELELERDLVVTDESCLNRPGFGGGSNS
jgi:hypothetical protein